MKTTMLAVMLLFAGAPALAHPHHRHHHDHHYHNYKRYFTCHNHPKKEIWHCHGHNRWKHGNRNYNPRPINFEFHVH